MAVYTLADGVLVQEVLSETVLLHTGQGEYYELNEVGSHMLERLRAHGDAQAALQELLSEYDVSPEEINQDFKALIRQLLDHGLILEKT